MSKPTFQQKDKANGEIVRFRLNTEKKLQRLDMESILKTPGMTIPDMALIIELQKETKPQVVHAAWEVERMSSQEHKENSIRFIDSGYNEDSVYMTVMIIRMHSRRITHGVRV